MFKRSYDCASGVVVSRGINETEIPLEYFKKTCSVQ